MQADVCDLYSRTAHNYQPIQPSPYCGKNMLQSMQILDLARLKIRDFRGTHVVMDIAANRRICSKERGLDRQKPFGFAF